MDGDGILIRLREAPTRAEAELVREYAASMSARELLSGMRFAAGRRRAEESGTLRVGRPGIVRREAHMITAEQARWRLRNWKLMLANYRRRGYSYPTISRIKKALGERARAR